MSRAARGLAVAALSALLGAGSALADVSPPPGAPPGHPPRPRTIQVSGEARVSVAPDAATFTVGAEAVGKSVSAATAEANGRMKAVLDVVAKAGVAAKDVRTSRYDVSVERPWKDGKPGPITGYRVSTSAEVRVRDLARLGAILDQVTAAGSNQLGSLRMERLDPKPQQLEALALAYANAREKANAIAIAAGAQLGDFVTVSESGGYRPVPSPSPMMARAAMADAAPAPVAEGELEYGARVEVVFGLR